MSNEPPTNGANGAPRSRELTSPIILALISTLLGGGVLGAVVNQFFTLPKTRAEAEKMLAEAAKDRAETAKVLGEMDLTKKSSIAERSSEAPRGWFLAGDDPNDYESGVDRNKTYRGKPSGYMKSREAPKGFGTMMQMFNANLYAGKRLRMTGIAKSEGVTGWAGFWMRIDGSSGKQLGFDNMQDRPINGTTGWTHQIVLDVPDNSVHVAFGVLLDGPGQVWVADVQLDSVGKNVPTTNAVEHYPDRPVNLSFDE